MPSQEQIQGFERERAATLWQQELCAEVEYRHLLHGYQSSEKYSENMREIARVYDMRRALLRFEWGVAEECEERYERT